VVAAIAFTLLGLRFRVLAPISSKTSTDIY
jgi:hypothetical protein